MEKIPLCVVGCGGMGHRHILAYRELEDSGMGNIEVVAVCDIATENAELGAREVERLFGRRPLVFTDLDDMLAQDEIAAIDVVTDPSTHHVIAVPALQAGKHALVEKPLGITVRACRAMIDAAGDAGVVLATAENARREPAHRLMRSILDHQLLGTPHLMVLQSLGGDDQIVITPWRHLKEKGAIGLDMSVHYTDTIQYYMGEFDHMFGHGLIVEPTRRRKKEPELDLESYRERFKTMPASVEATGEDSVLAMYRMKSAASVQFSYAAGRGSSLFECSVHGQLGAFRSPPNRSGKPVQLCVEGEEYEGEAILPLLPDYEPGEIIERLFGAGAVTYDLPREAVDAKRMAVEFHDFGEAIIAGRPPEVDGHAGLTAVAAVLGVYESGLVGRSVSMDEVLAGDVRAYQEEIDELLGLN